MTGQGLIRGRAAWRAFVSILISALILFILTRWTTWQDFAGQWQRLQWTWLAPAALCYWAEVLLMGVRAFILFSDRTAPFGSTVLVSNVHNFINKVLPARTGELAFPLLMQRYAGASGKRAFSVVVLARVADLYTVTLAFSAVFLLEDRLLAGSAAFWLPLALLWVALAGLTLMLWKGSRGWKAAWVPPATGPAGRFSRFLARPLALLVSLWRDLLAAWCANLRRKRALVAVAACSLALWAALYAMFVLLGRAQELPLNTGQLMLAASLAIFGTMVPVGGVGHFGGLEAGWTFGLLTLGLPAGQAGASAILVSLMATGFSMLLAASSLFGLELRARYPGK